MFTHNGVGYIAGLSISEHVLAMLETLGVTPTEKVVVQLQAYCGKALYKGAITSASDNVVIAMKANSLVAAALKGYIADDSVRQAFTTWQSLKTDSSALRENITLAMAEARATEAKFGLPAGTITNGIAKAPPALAEADTAFAQYATETLALFKARMNVIAKRDKFGSDVLEYARNNAAIEPASNKAGIAKAEVKTGTRRKRSTGNGTRRGFREPTSVAGIPWTGKWTSMAAQLLANGIVDAGNFINNPALGRAARAMKEHTFVFGTEEYKGAYVLEHLDDFKPAVSDD